MRHFNFGPGIGFKVYRDQPMGPRGRWIEFGPENVQTRLVLYPKSMMPNWEERKRSIAFACGMAIAIQKSFRR